MEIKILEIRDEGTFIPVLCVNMNPGDPEDIKVTADKPGDRIRERTARYLARNWYLRRCGYPCDGRPNIAITDLNANGKPFNNDPYGWKGFGARTYPTAHHFITDNWETLKDGDVVDVSFILKESEKPKVSERFDVDP